MKNLTPLATPPLQTIHLSAIKGYCQEGAEEIPHLNTPSNGSRAHYVHTQ